MKAFIKFNTISPISHLAPPSFGKGTAAAQRKLKIVVEKRNGQKEVQSLPVVSGGSIRGKNRRVFITKILEKLGYYQNNLLVGLSQEVFEALIAGGRQASKTSIYPQVDKYISLYSDLPFFGLFGGVLYKFFFAGRLSVGFALPMVKEVDYLFEKMGSPYSGDNLPGYDALTDNIGNRQTYVRTKIENIAVPDEVDFSNIIGQIEDKYPEAAQAIEQDVESYNSKIGEGDEDPKLKFDELKAVLTKDKEATKDIGGLVNIINDATPTKIVTKLVAMYNLQTIYSIAEPIPAGVNLHTCISLMPGFGDDALMKATFDAFVETVMEERFLGGIHSKGYGQVVTEAKSENGENFISGSDADAFWKWLEENKVEVCDNLENLHKYLFQKGD